ncbi:zeta-crystallin [Lindgomyces ingoldianus]|uniref:Zeta-crystallin n=1 Tax=Lindgomyces ingoldianus TaxID=673940 RepID=A0ACB6QLX6_9PLEO|nr:zeta-crystallin [Lindgomyces ingoldianus]KAF2467151.1 zeta-crystallin [Lindgomyces ingoldianus]
MKAIVIDQFVSDLASLKPREASIPQPKGPKDLHVRITHAAVTHVDTLYAQGLHQNNHRHVQPPFILGNEFAGIVTSSPASSPFRPGTRVFGGGLGSYAESICVDEGSVRRVPGRWSNAEACAVGASGAVSWGSLISVANLQQGETALILGASGGLGVMAVQIAKAIGARAITVVGDEEKAEMMRNLGADGVVDYHASNWEDEVKALTEDGEGVHVVYDAIGAIESGLKCLRYRGRLVIVGFAARGGKIEEVRANRILLKSITVHGYRFGEDGRRLPERTKEAWDGFMGLVEAGRIKPVIYKEQYQGLGEICRALEDLQMHKTWGRAILRINEGMEVDIETEAEQKARL